MQDEFKSATQEAQQVHAKAKAGISAARDRDSAPDPPRPCRTSSPPQPGT